MDGEIKDILEACFLDDKLFAKTFFPEAFSGPFTYLHDQIYDLMQSDERQVCIAAPRGLGKTTIARTKAAKNILYRESLFIPYVSKSESAAMLQTENLKRDLASNQMIKKIFGSVKPRNMGDGFSETFSKTSWVGFDTLTWPRGYTQQIRGLLYNNNRPDLFIVDDLEDDEQIDNEEYRRGLKEWFYGTLVKAVSRYDKNWRIIYIDTLKHEDALIQELLDSPDWASIRLELCDEENKSLVPEIITDKEIQADYERHERIGLLDVFYREFRNLPNATKDSSFKKEHFQYIEKEELQRLSGIEYAVIVDPAKTSKLQSADSAVVCVGIDTKSHKLYFADCEAGKFYPEQLYDSLFDMAIRWNAQVIGVETTSLEEFIKQPLKNEAVKRSVRAELIWLDARGGHAKRGATNGKDMRIAGLIPYYRQGTVVHVKGISDRLEAQLLSFPRSKRKDIMDAFAYIVELMEKGNLYFEPLYDIIDEEDLDDDYLDQLEYEDPVEGWRVV